ncbi:cupin domain-containing protein [Flavobacterium bizetiae]|uniref:cupin domain-containing protein n=1 Tax=Flavobacterium bizetiae TaxID=2704140 RepID=UPI0037571DD1
MKTNKIYAMMIVGLIALFAPSNAQAQKSGVKRTDLQKHDLSIPGKEMVQARIDFDAHTSFGKHAHPGEEVIYVLEGVLEYQIEDETPVTLKAGEVLFIPAGKFHSANNHTNTKATELATYIVEKGQPIMIMKK